MVVFLTSNVRLVEAPGNALLPARSTDLPKDFVANVSQVLTLDRGLLTERVERITPNLQRQVNEGLRLALDLQPAGKRAHG